MSKYILFKGAMNPKKPLLATDSKLRELSSVGYKQGKDYDVVSLKVLLDSKGKKKGGYIKKYAYGSYVRPAKNNE